MDGQVVGPFAITIHADHRDYLNRTVAEQLE